MYSKILATSFSLFLNSWLKRSKLSSVPFLSKRQISKSVQAIKIDANNNAIKYPPSVDNTVHNKMLSGSLNFNTENTNPKKNPTTTEKWIKFCTFISLPQITQKPFKKAFKTFFWYF
ncbi:hypothetical protein KHP_0402 [Helicobacter pylori 51]|uniref:Uncharacterized protein n=1 Tax=Helicobacter pylori (strain 51) TaxID=290847 RepID=A0AAI8EZB4_HELP1|nr:hypothetical protein KHP_0402 [Helicobacter pylori 51]